MVRAPLQQDSYYALFEPRLFFNAYILVLSILYVLREKGNARNRNVDINVAFAQGKFGSASGFWLSVYSSYTAVCRVNYVTVLRLAKLQCPLPDHERACSSVTPIKLRVTQEMKAHSLSTLMRVRSIHSAPRVCPYVL